MCQDIDKINKTEKAIEHVNDFAKLHFQLLVTWFTFFMTVNWATLGWLAGNSGGFYSEKLGLIAYVFLYQNILAIAVCFFSIFYFSSINKRLNQMEKIIYENNEVLKGTFNFNLYRFSILGMILSIVPIAFLWFCIAQN